jgi:ribose-phosphate pyrophosphokinase
MIVFSGNSNPALTSRICGYLDIPPGEAIVSTFSDGETRVEIKSNVRGRDVFIVQSTCSPANHHIIEAVTMVDACRRASADHITLVCPYFGYARQERGSLNRTPITAKLIADILTTSGIDRLVVIDLHTSAIQGFFNIPVDHVFAKPVFEKHIESTKNLLIVSPDAGGASRARMMAKHFNCGLAIVDKRRDTPNESSVMHIIGNVEGKECLIVDDICDTGGSLVKAADALMKNGAVSVSAAITHAVLSGDAISKIEESAISRLIVTDTIPLSSKAKKCNKIVQLSVAELLSRAVRRIHAKQSVTSLFLEI